MLGSLKAQLTALVLLAVVVVWGGATWLTYQEARHEIDELLDAHLAQSVSLLVAQAGDEIEEFDTSHAEVELPLSPAVAFQVWEHGTRLTLHSIDAPDVPLANGGDGFSNQTIAGAQWRVFSTWDRERESLVHVGERVEARVAIAREMLAASLAPLLLAVPLLGLLIWLAVRQGMRPLDRIAAAVEVREARSLDPLDTQGVPSELRVLLNRLNGLFARVSDSLEHERRFTADAAHELRTPLAAIRAQAQVALGATDEGERTAVLHKVVSGCDRAARVVEQLLTLARLDAATAEVPGHVALRALARAAIAEAAPAAVARAIDVSLEPGAEFDVAGHSGLLQILLRNLLDNAIRYTPDGGAVQVGVISDARGIVLAVADNGVGIAPEEQSRVLERFYRVVGTRADGSGLGLSIVTRVAAVHGARLELGAGIGGRGTRVSVTFPHLPAGHA